MGTLREGDRRIGRRTARRDRRIESHEFLIGLGDAIGEVDKI
jgi:hypothetical protein